MAEDDFPALGAAPAQTQQQQSKQAKKQKGKKMALDDFLQETSIGGSCELK